jgi:transcription elongation factor Elf1
MPLRDIRCNAGHVSEVLVRGVEQSAPFACSTCGDEAKVIPSTFGVVLSPELQYEAPTTSKARKGAAKVIDRAGGGRAVLTDEGGYRLALTHTCTCPSENRRRNVAITGEIADSVVRVMCEACGFTWAQATNTDNLHEGYEAILRPGKNYSAYAPTGSGYVQPERAV